jgi:arylsulfatase A-like enzyme
MGIYGYTKNTTPNIDKWAQNATVFTNMKTVAPITFPSFFALMTGTDPVEEGVYNNNFSDDSFGKVASNGNPFSNNKTLAEILHQKGYKTAAFITNAALDPKITKINKGFEDFHFLTGDPFAEAQGKKDYSTFIRQVIPWLSQNKNEKFFMWVHLIGPHAPYSPQLDFACKSDPEFCNKLSDEDMAGLELERKSWEGCKEVDIPQKTLGKFQGLYDAEIMYDDELVGEILQKINALHLDKNTLIVFYGDHGEGFEHNYYFHHSNVLYKSALNIPLIFSFPNGRKTVNNELADNTQILNSLLRVLNIHKADFWDNHTFPAANKEFIYSSSADLTKYSIQNKKYKYIYSLPESCLYHNQTEELYDLSSDPQETTNILKDKPSVAAQFKRELLKHFNNYGLPKLLKKDENKAVDQEKQKIIDTLKNIGY